METNCNPDSDSEDATTTSSNHPVFIDTNLDTHLALIVSDSDTVCDLKKKIMSEHPQCFPNFGDIKINALKVKRKRCLYHLSDSMLVKSAFEGAKKCWFVAVDAFSLKQHHENKFPIEPAVSNQLALFCFTKTPSGDLPASHTGIVNPEFASCNPIKDVLNDAETTNMGVGGEPCNTSVLDTIVRSDSGELKGTLVECRNDKSRNTNGDVHSNNSMVDEEHSKSRSGAKRKRKRESEGAGNPLEQNKILFSEETSTQKDRILEDSIDYKLKTTTTTSDSLFTEPPDMVAISSSGRKKRRTRNDLLRDQVVTAKPSSLHDVGKDIFKENGGIVAKNSDKPSDAAIVSDKNKHHAKLSGTFKVSQKQKHPESVQEVVKLDKLHSSSLDSFLTELPGDAHLVADLGSGKKKSENKKKLPTDQVVNPRPSSLHGVGRESFKEHVTIVAKDSDKISDAAIVSEENMQHAKLTFEVSQKQKHRESVQEVVKQDKLHSSSVDSLLNEVPEDVHLIAGPGSEKKKSTKKKKLSTDQAVNPEPSSLHDVGKETFGKNVRIVAENSDKVSDAAVFSEENMQHAELSGTFEVSKKQKHHESVQDVVEQGKLPSSSVDSLLTEPTEDVLLVAGSSSGKKKRKKERKLPTDEVVNAEPSSLRDVGKEGSKENVGTVSKDSDKAFDAVIVSEENVQHATLPGTFKVSQKQNQPEPVREVVEQSKLPSSSVDSLFTEPPEDVHLVAGSSSGKKKSKKKKKLPTDQVVNPGPSSVHDVGKEGSKENVGTVSKDSDKASDAIIVPEQKVQHATLSGTIEVSQKQKHSEPAQEVLELDKLPYSSPGINASVPDASNEKSKSDAPESGARSRLKGRKTSKKHNSTNAKEFPSVAVNELDNLKKDDIRSQQENIVLDDHNIETSHPYRNDSNEEQRDLPQNHDPEEVTSEKCEPPLPGEADMHSKESVVSTNLVESNIVMESGKSAGGKRVKMRARKSVATKQVMASMEHDDNSVSGISLQVPHFNDHSNDEAKKEESFLSLTGWKGMSKQKTVDTSFVGANGQNDDMCGSEAESLPLTQVDKTQENAEIDGNLRKKAKNNETSDAKSVADLPVKEQKNEVEPLQQNQVNMTQKNAEDVDENSRKKTKKSRNSAAKSLPDLPSKEPEVGYELLTPSNDRLRDVDAPSKTKRKSKSVKTNSKQLTGQELEFETNCGFLNPQQTLRTVDSTQVPSLDTLVSNTIERPLQDDDGNASKNSNTTDANYESEVSKRDGGRVNFKDYFMRGEHKHEVMPVELVVDNVSEAKGSDREVKTRKNAKKVVLPAPATSPDPENSINSYVNQGSDRRPHGVSKASNEKMGEVVNSSRHEKSLLATPGAIFRDGSSDSSEEESGTVNSDSSTKTPSDNSSSSGYSEGDSKLNLDSPRNGIYGGKEKDGRKSITKSQALSSKNVTLDTILRSSSRFKKAKLTASQSQFEDAESQPVDFVPDSQANL